MRRLIPFVLLLALAGCGRDERVIKPVAAAKETGSAHHFDLEQVADGFAQPTYVSSAPGDGDALWVLEQAGRVIRLDGGRRETVVDLEGQLLLGAEQGLLGMAFAPDFARSRLFYLHWSDRRGDTRVAEFRLATRRPPRGELVRELLFVEQPEANHNGGSLAFGHDGRLYLGLGDGGGAFDTFDNAQNLDSRLGKILALDLDADGPPKWTVVAYGLRNPWRFSFHPALDEMWIGDVGQDENEEIDRFILEPDEPPKNFGWPAFEASKRVQDRDLDPRGEVVWPVAAYTHRDGCSVTGGVIYAGTQVQGLNGRYVYGDFCSGAIWTLRPTPEGGASDVRREKARLPRLAHIGTDARGELLFASGGGTIHRARTP